MPQLGIISLFGIALNTAIIFIEFADFLISEKCEQKLKSVTGDNRLEGSVVGLSRSEFRQCLVDAGKQRMLPIFLTTATTNGGLIPSAHSGGPLWTCLAWAMIAGLSVATLLHLFEVRALYAIFVETFGIEPIPSQ